MINNIINYLKDKKILILGFGREGKSTYNFIRKYLPDKELYIGDINNVDIDDDKVILKTGEDYLDNLSDYDLVIKSPGISFKDVDTKSINISSQLELFLEFVPNKMIGITGTKGKSTTTSLIYKVLTDQNVDAILMGNIGRPLLDYIEDIKEDTILVNEMSSHQLEFVKHSPYIAIITNLYQEHLDHYNSFEEYMQAKINICRYQKESDFFIYNSDDINLTSRIDDVISNKIEVSKYEEIPEVSNSNLKGDSSIYNILFTLAVSDILMLNKEKAIKSINEFKTLPHRMEYVGTYHNIKFYDDAIATIPEATVNSVSALKDVDTLIFGGLDRGVNLSSLVKYLDTGIVRNLICMPKTGYLIADRLNNTDINVFKVETMDEAVEIAFKETEKDKICLLAPAAASYNKYKNFEEKGNHFQKLVKNYK